MLNLHLQACGDQNHQTFKFYVYIIIFQEMVRRIIWNIWNIQPVVYKSS